MKKQYLKRCLNLSLLTAGIFTAGCNSGATPSVTSSSDMSANMVVTSDACAEAANATVDCRGVAEWNSDTIYDKQDTRVVYQGIEYKNNWSTKDNEPASNNCGTAVGKIWTVVGSCSSSPQPSHSVASSANHTRQ